MIGKTVSHYKIISKLGEGGMGVVYKALDTKLDRTVALKFLPPQLTHDPTTKKRFIREARNASAIQHNNVCAIHEIGETDDGQMYISMAYYEGKTLDRLLAEGEITVESALDFIIQLAEGLSKAHETGITHRDIKPANVLVTSDGIPKLLDFGLAKLGADTRVTKTGITVGTVAYMSPEQARGEEVDARSDIWSLGVVLYELLAGVLPFPGEQSAAVMYGIMSNDPPRITDYWKEAPERLQYIIDRALMKNREQRFEDAAAMVRELIEVETQLVGSGKKRRSPTRLRKGAQSRKRTRLIGVAAMVVILAVVAWLVILRLGPDGSGEAMALAVMDFNNLSDPEEKVQTASMAGLLNVGLVQNVSARVVSPDYLRDIGRRLFGAEKGAVEESQLLEVAKQSGASLMLAGQLGASGENRYVVWRLVDTKTGESLGAKRVDGSDPMKLVDEIVVEVAQILERKFGLGGDAAPQSVVELTTENPEAQALFAAGVLAARKYQNDEAIEHFKGAVALDSTFALAYFELASAQFETNTAFADARRSTEEAWRLRDRLSVKDRMRLEAWRLQINYKVVEATDVYRELAVRWPDDYDILRSLFTQLYFWWSFPEALEVALRATSLFPDDEFFSSFPNQVLAKLGRKDEAIVDARKFMTRFPAAKSGPWMLAHRYLEAGFPDSAKVMLKRRLSMGPKDIAPQREIAVTLPYKRGDLKSAIKNCEEFLTRDDLTANQLSETRVLLCSLYYQAGRYERALATLDLASSAATSRIDRFYWDRYRMGYMLRTGKVREVLQWAEAWTDTLRINADEIDDPQLLGIARWSLRDYRTSALVRLDSLDTAEIEVERELQDSEEFGAYARRMGLFDMLRLALKREKADEALLVVYQIEAIGGNVGNWTDGELEELRADAHRLKGQYDEAEHSLQEDLRIYPGHARAHYVIGRLYEEMNRPEDAKRELTKFLEMWSDADEELPQLVDARERLAALTGETP